MEMNDKIMLAKFFCFACWIEFLVHLNKFILVKFAIRTITNETLKSEKTAKNNTINGTNRMPFANFYRRKEVDTIQKKPGCYLVHYILYLL